MLMFTSELSQAGHTKRFTVTRIAAGWEIREELDSQVVRTVSYMDWHRVERALERFKRQGRPGDADPQES
jgi:hypothetical protein